MSEILSLFEQFWGILLAVAGGVGGYFRWRVTRESSTKMLYDELEKLKQKVIIQVSREVDQATEIAEKDRIIADFKSNCPECYESYIKKRNK